MTLVIFDTVLYHPRNIHTTIQHFGSFFASTHLEISIQDATEVVVGRSLADDDRETDRAQPVTN